MGVKGLWKILNPIGTKVNPSNCTLAVDVSIWIHQYKDMNETDAIYYISKKIIKLLYHNIKPVFVFDGPPNEFKNRVIEQRKKENFEKLIKDVINNKICKKCKTKVRICKHGGIIKDNHKILDITLIPEWGKIHNDTDLSKKNVIKKKLLNNHNHYKINNDFRKSILSKELQKPLSIENDIHKLREIINSDTYTVNHKLKMLVKLREKRKERLEIDDTTMLNFSKSQIKNVKSRNFVSHYIKKLENKNTKNIYSDCKKTYVFTKNKDECSSSNEEIDNFLEIEKNTEINNLEVEYLAMNKYYDKETQKINNEQINNKDLKKVNIKSLNKNYMQNGFFNNQSGNFSSDEEQKFDLVINKNKNLLENYQISNETKNEINKKDFEYTSNNESLDFLSIQSLIKKIISVLNLPFIDSPSESDAQCGFLCKNNLVDGVITEDNDILLYGGTVYKNFFRKNKYILKYDPCVIKNNLGLSTVDLINIGFVLGSDYTIGIKGIGIKKVRDYIKTKEFNSIEKNEYLKIYLNSKVNTEWKPKFGVLNVDKFLIFCKKNNIDDEKIAELEFYFNCKIKSNM